MMVSLLYLNFCPARNSLEPSTSLRVSYRSSPGPVPEAGNRANTSRYTRMYRQYFKSISSLSINVKYAKRCYRSKKNTVQARFQLRRLNFSVNIIGIELESQAFTRPQLGKLYPVTDLFNRSDFDSVIGRDEQIKFKGIIDGKGDHIRQ
jgi:hypothetical protein